MRNRRRSQCPLVQNAQPTNRRSRERESPSSFLDTDCLLNFTTLRSVAVGRGRRRRRRRHLSPSASAVAVRVSAAAAVPLNQFSIPSYFFLRRGAAVAKSEFARFFIRSRQRHKTAMNGGEMLDFFTILLFDVTAIEVTLCLTHSLALHGIFFFDIIL